MAKIDVTDGNLVVEIVGVRKALALKSRLTIPLGNVRGATADPGMGREPKGVRAPGTYVPRVITAGTYRVDGERVFWDVSNPEKTVVVELENEDYDRLVLQVDDPRATVALIERSVPTP